jgi:hypothetical protein
MNAIPKYGWHSLLTLSYEIYDTPRKNAAYCFTAGGLFRIRPKTTAFDPGNGCRIAQRSEPIQIPA